MHTSHTRFSRSSEASSLITLLSAARREGNLLQVGKRAQRQRLGHDEHRCVVTSFITFTAHRARPAPLLHSPNPASWQTVRCRLPLCVCMCAVGGRLSCSSKLELCRIYCPQVLLHHIACPTFLIIFLMWPL